MPTNINIKNTNQTHAIRLIPQDRKPVIGKKTSEINQKWEDVGTYMILAPGEVTGVWISDGRRVLIEELPT